MCYSNGGFGLTEVLPHQYILEAPAEIKTQDNLETKIICPHTPPKDKEMENPEDARQGSVLPHQDILDENPQEISQWGVFPNNEKPTDAEMQHVGPEERLCMLHAVTDQPGQGGSLCGQPGQEGGAMHATHHL